MGTVLKMVHEKHVTGQKSRPWLACRHANHAHADHPGCIGQARMASSSFIRTITVGSGVTPDLLTFRQGGGSARGLGPKAIPPVGNHTPPRRRNYPP